MAHQKPNRGQATQAEQSFLDRYDASEFDHPSLAVDVVLLTSVDGELRVLVIKRGEHPGKGKWSLPGGFVGIEESLDDAAHRILQEKAFLKNIFVEQLYSFGSPDRDPRTRVVSITYYALVDAVRIDSMEGSESGTRQMGRILVPEEGEKIGTVKVFDDADEELTLAFDHADILGMAVQRIRGKLNYTPIGFQLLPRSFTLRQLQRVHETILDRTVNKDAFRRRMLATGQIESTGERETEVDHRPAELYRFTRKSAIYLLKGAHHG